MHPEDDKELRLARRIGELLEAGTPLTALADETTDGDTLVGSLLALRAQDGGAPPAPVTDRLWNALEREMDADAATPNRRRGDRPSVARRRTRIVWSAMTATLLLLFGLGWWWLVQDDAPTLVAEAGQTRVVYTAPDGSTITLRPHSRLYAVGVGEVAMHYRLEGEAFFDVLPREDRTFSVRGGPALVSVLGTRFDVSTWGTQTTVFLEEGRVRLTNVSRTDDETDALDAVESVEMVPGQRATITASGRLLPPTDVAAAPYIDWLSDEVTFEQEPLARILSELAHHYDVTFDVPELLDQETVSGRILLHNRRQSLDDLGVVLGGRFTSDDGRTFRFVPD